MQIRVQSQDFDLGVEVSALYRHAGVGAVASFVGVCRAKDGDQAGGEVSFMELEHYPGMTEAAIEEIAAQARKRWPIIDGVIVHRVGSIAAGEQIVLVAVATAHRQDAFDACAFLMDYLKTQAPFWKKEHSGNLSRWVDARSSDDQALARWGIAVARNRPD